MTSSAREQIRFAIARAAELEQLVAEIDAHPGANAADPRLARVVQLLVDVRTVVDGLEPCDAATAGERDVLLARLQRLAGRMVGIQEGLN